ncbi:putative formate dehydrogenase formation protein [Escherichia coli]|uniref:Putative formate dehydrogenase formation protein n=1 Tax=Escherichia coli TaxID=562 RepID=A0A376RTE4_ECOLX|nr:putative formate dehydrogenase formation protein [Escherichia coli]
MSIRIIPQDELGSSEKRTADMIPPLLFPRLKNLYNRRAERLRELAEIIRWVITCALLRLSPTPRKWCCTTIRWRWI